MAPASRLGGRLVCRRERKGVMMQEKMRAEETKAAEGECPDEKAQAVMDALAGRAAFYDLLASLYFKPLTAQQIENLASLDLSVYSDVSELFAEGLNDVTRYLAKRDSGTRQELAVDFTAAFAGTSSWKGEYAVPYESVFTSEEGLLFQDAYHEVLHLYRQNGIARQEGYDFPDDHLSFMCEFLSILSKRASDALEAGDTALALEQVTASRSFLQEHILSWFSKLRERASLLLETRFYRGVLKISEGFFLFDEQALDELAEVLAA